LNEIVTLRRIMVLENTPTQSEELQNDRTYDYVADPSSPFAKLPHLKMKPELLVRPGILTLGYLGFGGKSGFERKVQRAAYKAAEATKVAIQRYPTQEELDALVSRASKSTYETRTGIPLGATAGVLHSYLAAKKALGTPNKFSTWQVVRDQLKLLATADPSFRKIMVASGVRVFAWALLGYTASAVYASYRDATHVLTDPRLDRWREEFKNQKPEDIRRRKIEHAQETYRERLRSRQQKRGEQHQEGPGEDLQASVQTSNAYYSSESAPESIEMSKSEPRQHAPWLARSGYQNDGTGSDIFDDASPTAPEYQREGLSSTSGGSWERIRQQNASSDGSYSSNSWKAQPLQGPQQQSSSSSPSSHQPDHYERDVRREREHAQLQFDRMLEAERKASQDSNLVDGAEGKGRGWKRW
jgi:hypothetical protein